MVRKSFKDFILTVLSLLRGSSMYFRCDVSFSSYIRDAVAGNSTRMNYFDTRFSRHLSFVISTYEVPAFNSQTIDGRIAPVLHANLIKISINTAYAAKYIILLKIVIKKIQNMKLIKTNVSQSSQ